MVMKGRRNVVWCLVDLEEDGETTSELIAFHVFIPGDVKVAGGQVLDLVETTRDLIAFHVFVVGSSMNFLVCVLLSKFSRLYV
jgi:hypothetical protein